MVSVFFGVGGIFSRVHLCGSDLGRVGAGPAARGRVLLDQGQVRAEVASENSSGPVSPFSQRGGRNRGAWVFKQGRPHHFIFSCFWEKIK